MSALPAAVFSAPVRPRLRSLDIRPYVHQGHDYLLLRDPTQLSEATLLVPQPLALILTFLDGLHDTQAITRRFHERYGVALPVSSVEELVAALDEALMLGNERAAQARVAALAAYRQAPFRTPALAGLSYPADAGALWQLLQEYLEGADGVETLPVDWSRPVGLLSPHIDYPRGGAVYAQVWKRAAQAAREADLAIIFGTDHYGTDRFTLTRQHYATPYGILPTEQNLVAALAGVLGEERAFQGELRHRGEHSLELVAVWLHHMRAGAALDVVPILVGGFHSFIQNGASPAADPLLAAICATIRIQSKGRRVLVIASGDLAHVGPAFGGTPLDSYGKTAVQNADAELITRMRAGDAAGFFEAIKRVRDQHNVCGVAPVYLALSTLASVKGQQFGYAVCPADEAGSSIVTVTGMVFH